MGLDLALGGVVLIAALRGWLKGFLVQAIRLGGLVAAVYLALPVRDYVKPYVVGSMPTVRPDLMDRLLWWGSAVATYFVLVGVASLLIAASRRKTFGLSEMNRGDQFAGFGVGLVKGLIAASFLLAGVQSYASPYLDKLPWAGEQLKTSVVWEWNGRYTPAAQIWAAPPVRHFVAQIQSMGMTVPMGTTTVDLDGSTQASNTIPKLALPQSLISGLGRDELDPELSDALDRVSRELKGLGGDQ